jgi:hypothetical protein
MTSSFFRLAVAASALGAVGALGSAAGAVTAPTAARISVDHPCYVNSAARAEVTVTGTGFGPGDRVQLTAPGFSATATAGPDGSLSAMAPAPVYASGPVSKTYELTAVDETQAGVTARAPLRVTNLAVAVSRRSVANVRKDKVTYTFSGFEPSKRIYGYYLHGRSVARAVFSRAHGPCGMLRQRALLYPGGRPHHDRYTVVFEDTPRYTAKAFPRVTGQLQLLHF